MVAYRQDPVDSRGVIARADCNGASTAFAGNLFGGRRHGLPEGSTGPHGTCPDLSELIRGSDDEGPIFSGGDEDTLHHLGDVDGLGGSASDFGTGIGVNREGLSPIGAEPLYFFDDDLRWGKRRRDECGLNFMDGDDSASWLGDGEDLP